MMLYQVLKKKKKNDIMSHQQDSLYACSKPFKLLSLTNLICQFYKYK